MKNVNGIPKKWTYTASSVGENIRTDGNQKMKLYMMTTQDKYELPLAVADSVKELAQMTGHSAQRISEALSHRKIEDRKRKTKNMNKTHPKWHKVEIEDEQNRS